MHLFSYSSSRSRQIYGIVVIGGWSFFMSFLLLKIIQALPSLAPTSFVQIAALSRTCLHDLERTHAREHARAHTHTQTHTHAIRKTL